MANFMVSAVGSQLSPSMIRNTSENIRPNASSRDQPVIVSATTLRYVTLPSMSVLMTPSPMESSVICARCRSTNSASLAEVDSSSRGLPSISLLILGARVGYGLSGIVHSVPKIQLVENRRCNLSLSAEGICARWECLLELHRVYRPHHRGDSSRHKQARWIGSACHSRRGPA